MWPVLSRMAMAMPQLFLIASASAAAITFLATSSPIGDPEGVVGGAGGACWALAIAAARVMARIDAVSVLIGVLMGFLPSLLTGLGPTSQDKIARTTDQFSGACPGHGHGLFS